MIKSGTGDLLFIIIKYRIIWNSIILSIALDLLYDSFEITTVLLFYSNDKDLKEIQLIIISTQVVNLIR